jgi:Ca2+-transporting ATPase
MLHDLCVGKTGTITKGDMNVLKFQIGNAYHLVHEHQRDECPDHFNTTLELDRTYKNFIIECILNNTDVRFEANDKEFKYEPRGQALEVGLIKFLIDNEIDVPSRLIERNKFHKKLALLPFDQDLKRMTTIRQVDDRIVVYSKGAPEALIPLCEQVLAINFNFQRFYNYPELLNTTISDMAGGNGYEPLKVISLAYKELEAREF